MSSTLSKWNVILVKGLEIDCKGVEGRRCMRGSDGKLCFNDKEKYEVWMDYMEKIMNKK